MSSMQFASDDMLLTFNSNTQIVDWHKDKGKAEDHKTFVNVIALKVMLISLSYLIITSAEYVKFKGFYFFTARNYGQTLKN